MFIPKFVSVKTRNICIAMYIATYRERDFLRDIRVHHDKICIYST